MGDEVKAEYRVVAGGKADNIPAEVQDVIDAVVEKAAVDLGMAAAKALNEGGYPIDVDAQIENLLNHPTIQAMIDNAVEGASANAVEDTETELDTFAPPDVQYVSLAKFEDFVVRIEKAFKHAGFKF